MVKVADDRPTAASALELADFLASVERRAFKQALFAVRDGDDALDIVQDAMLKLSDKYGAKPVTELPLLFQRILQNTIRDHYRRQKVRSAWTTLLSAFSSDDEDADPLESLPTAAVSGMGNPQASLEQRQLIAVMGCSEGSVKTHCSRAPHSLAAALKARGVELP